jgi:hypothetical protein
MVYFLCVALVLVALLLYGCYEQSKLDPDVLEPRKLLIKLGVWLFKGGREVGTRTIENIHADWENRQYFKIPFSRKIQKKKRKSILDTTQTIQQPENDTKHF